MPRLELTLTQHAAALPDASVKLPKHSDGDVGFDLYALEDAIIPAQTTTVIHTGWQLADEPIVSGACIHGNLRSLLKIEGRSGLALKGIFPVGGIIDPSFRGEICPIMFNSTQSAFAVTAGDRIAQLVWYPVVADWYEYGKTIDIVQVSHITQTARGTAGFGSSGTR